MCHMLFRNNAISNAIYNVMIKILLSLNVYSGKWKVQRHLTATTSDMCKPFLVNKKSSKHLPVARMDRIGVFEII